MINDEDARVVIKQSILNGSDQPGVLQRVAIVYIGGREYRVSAPPEAKGNALDWVPHFAVTQDAELGSEVDIGGDLGHLIQEAVKHELEEYRRSAVRIEGIHPDRLHSNAQICLNGHVQHCDGSPFDSEEHCTRCGAACIDECPHCKEPIRGDKLYRPLGYSLPQFCHRCGGAYPWMQERLKTAQDLLDHDDKLTPEDRESLWDDLKYVTSDPKAPLVPAKRKLIGIRLEKAKPYVREFVLDLIAKTIAEVSKG